MSGWDPAVIVLVLSLALVGVGMLALGSPVDRG